MKTILLQYQDKTLECSLPESWNEVDLQTFFRLEQGWDKSSLLGLFSALTGLDLQTLGNVTAKSGKALYDHIEWLSWDNSLISKEMKGRTVSFLGKTVTVPKDVEWETLGQYEMAAQVIANEPKDEKRIPRLIAIYLQKAYDGTFQAANVSAIEQAVLKEPAIAMLPLYSFFLRRLKKSQKIGIRFFLQLLKQLRNGKMISTTSQQEGLN